MEKEMQKEFEIQPELKLLLESPEKLREMATLLEKLADVIESKEKIYHSTEECVAFHLKEIGIPETASGYKFLVRTICTIVDNYTAGSKINLSKDVYPWVASKFSGISSTAVFEQIRKTINAAWKYREESSYKYYEGVISTKTQKPIVGKFLIKVAHIVRRDIRVQ